MCIVICGNSINELEQDFAMAKQAIASGRMMGAGGQTTADVENALRSLREVTGYHSPIQTYVSNSGCDSPCEAWELGEDCDCCCCCDCDPEDEINYEVLADEILGVIEDWTSGCIDAEDAIDVIAMTLEQAGIVPDEEEEEAYASPYPNDDEIHDIHWYLNAIRQLRDDFNDGLITEEQAMEIIDMYAKLAAQNVPFRDIMSYMVAHWSNGTD